MVRRAPATPNVGTGWESNMDSGGETVPLSGMPGPHLSQVTVAAHFRPSSAIPVTVLAIPTGRVPEQLAGLLTISR